MITDSVLPLTSSKRQNMLLISNYNVQNFCLLQTLQLEFKASLSEMAAGVSGEESEPQDGTSMDPSALLPPRFCKLTENTLQTMSD